MSIIAFRKIELCFPSSLAFTIKYVLNRKLYRRKHETSWYRWLNQLPMAISWDIILLNNNIRNKKPIHIWEDGSSFSRYILLSMLQQPPSDGPVSSKYELFMKIQSHWYWCDISSFLKNIRFLSKWEKLILGEKYLHTKFKFEGSVVRRSSN